MVRLGFPPGVILGMEQVIQWRGETNKDIVFIIIGMLLWTAGERYKGWVMIRWQVVNVEQDWDGIGMEIQGLSITQWVMIQWQVVNVEQSRWSACGQRSARDWNWSEPVISSTANIIITCNFWGNVHKLRSNCHFFWKSGEIYHSFHYHF